MAEEAPPEGGSGVTERKRTETGATALDVTGGILGLIVFIVGVVLVVLVYNRATQMYQEIPTAIEQAKMGSDDADETADDPSNPGEAPGAPYTARPGGKPLVKVAAEFGLRFLWLILIGFLGFLIAAMGAKLAGAHRGKRT